MNDSLKIAVAGATGYVGVELVKILSKHPKVKIKYLCARNSIGKSINQINNKIKKKNLPKISLLNNVNFQNIDILFTALPNGEAQIIAKKIKNNVKLIDLSADFRINNVKDYRKWYGKDHRNKNLIKNSIYSLCEFSKKS